MWGPMMGYHFGGWGWMMGLNAVFWLLLILAVVALVMRAARGPAAAPPRPATGLDVLAERYARGEIPREEYLEKKADLLGHA